MSQNLSIKKEISEANIGRALEVLIDNGVDADEAPTVLQAIGYTLLDAELFPVDTASESYVRIRTYDHFEYGDGTPLFFLRLGGAEQNPSNRLAILQFIKRLDTLYGDLDEDTMDWALEYQLWTRMLLSDDTAHIMLNPRHIALDSTFVDEVSVFIARLYEPRKSGMAVSLYRNLVNRGDALRKCWKRIDANDFYCDPDEL